MRDFRLKSHSIKAIKAITHIKRQTDQWNEIEKPERNPRNCCYLTLNKNAQNIQDG